MLRNTLLIALLPLAVGCQTMSHTEEGAAKGAVIGGVGGTILGAATGDPVAGAAVGAIGGALVGGAIGNAEDQREAHAVAAASRLGLTDVVTLTQQGTDADVIVNQIRTTGSTFTLSTADIQYLTQQNVSPKVISAMQNARQGGYRPQRVIVHEEVYPPPAIIIARPWPHRWHGGHCHW